MTSLYLQASKPQFSVRNESSDPNLRPSLPKIQEALNPFWILLDKPGLAHILRSSKSPLKIWALTLSKPATTTPCMWLMTAFLSSTLWLDQKRWPAFVFKMTEKHTEKIFCWWFLIGKRSVIFSDSYVVAENVCFLCEMPTFQFGDYGLIYCLQLLRGN